MSQLKSLVSEKIGALSLAAHRDEEGARFALELIVKPFGIKPGKNLAWNNVGKKFAGKVKDMTDADLGLTLVQAPHDLVAQYIGIEVSKETVPAEEAQSEVEPMMGEDPPHIGEILAAVEDADLHPTQLSGALQDALADATAAIHTATMGLNSGLTPEQRDEAYVVEGIIMQTDPDPAKREEARVEEAEAPSKFELKYRAFKQAMIGLFGEFITKQPQTPNRLKALEGYLLALHLKPGATMAEVTNVIENEAKWEDLEALAGPMGMSLTPDGTGFSYHIYEPKVELLMHNILLDGRNLGADWTGKGWDMSVNGKVNVTLALPKEATPDQLGMAYKAWQESLTREVDTKRAHADILSTRANINAMIAAIGNHLSKGIKFSEEVGKARLFLSKERDAALQALGAAQRGMEAKNARDLLPLNKVKELIVKARQHGANLQTLAVVWSIEVEKKFETGPTEGIPPKPVNKPAVAPATQPPQTGGEEKKPMEKISEIKAAIIALKAEFNGLSEAARKRVQKDFFKNIASIEGHIKEGRLEKAMGAIEGQKENLRKAVAATTPKAPPVTEPVVEHTPDTITPEDRKEEFLGKLFAAESNVSNPTPPANESAKEDTVSKPVSPKSNVETTSQRAKRLSIRNNQPANAPAQQAGQTPATTQEKPVSNNPQQEKPVTRNAPKFTSAPKAITAEQYAAIAKDEKAVKVMGPKPITKKLKSTVLGGIRCWFHNFDQRMRMSFGPLPGGKEFGALAESLKLACEGEEKAIISPKGKGDVRDALVRGMNLLTEAAAAAKHRMFSVQVNGKDVHVPARIAELETLIPTLKNGEKQQAQLELTKLQVARDAAATKWGTDAAQASASMMRDALKALTPEDAAKMAIHIQTLGNYGVVRNLPEGEGRFIIKGFKPEITIERVKELAKPYVAAEGLKLDDKVAKDIKERVESVKTDADYQRLLSDVALLRSQIARLLKAEPGEEKKVEDMQQRSMQLAIVGGVVDELRVGSTAPTLNGWTMVKANAPVWTRDHDLLVSLILSAKDGEHALPGCGEDKKETVGKLAASILVTFAYGVEPSDGGSLVCHEWQTVLDGIKNAKMLAEQVSKPGFRGYGRQIVWGLYVGTRWLVLRITGLINWALSPVKGVYYAIKALGLYGLGVATSGVKSEEYKASAKAAIERSGQCFKDFVMIPWNGVKGAWNYFFGKKAEDNKGTSAPNTTDTEKDSNMKTTFAQSMGLEGITSYSWGTDDNKKWADQSTGQKVLTSATLPFRAVKRIVVAQPAISIGVVAGGIAGGVVGTMVLGTMGITTVAAVAIGVVAGGLLGWGVKALFSGKSDKKADVKAPVEAPKAAAPVAPVAAPVAAPVQQAAA